VKGIGELEFAAIVEGDVEAVSLEVVAWNGPGELSGAVLDVAGDGWTLL